MFDAQFDTFQKSKKAEKMTGPIFRMSKKQYVVKLAEQ